MSDRHGSARKALLTLPSAGLGTWPTPLHRLDRFGAAIGAEVWIKRDDVQGVALAGNKIRKFNLVVGQAMADGCDTLVTTGAVQSNSARTGASAAAATGMNCHLVLSGEPPDTVDDEPAPTANLLLDHLVGATIHHAGDASWVELNQQVDDLVASSTLRGGGPSPAPIGCSSPLGSLGFARALLELEAQAPRPRMSPRRPSSTPPPPAAPTPACWSAGRSRHPNRPSPVSRSSVSTPGACTTTSPLSTRR